MLLAKKINVFVAVINLRNFVRRHIILAPIIKTLNYTLNYTKEDRVEIEKKKNWSEDVKQRAVRECQFTSYLHVADYN
jgi:hypothetical protein